MKTFGLVHELPDCYEISLLRVKCSPQQNRESAPTQGKWHCDCKVDA